MKLLDQLTKVKQNNVTRSSCTVALVSLQKPLFSCSFLKFSLQTAYSTSDVLRKVEAFVLLTATRHNVCFREFGTWVQNCGSLWHLWMYSSTSDEAVKKYFVGQLSNLKINFNLVCCLACCCCWRNWLTNGTAATSKQAIHQKRVADWWRLDCSFGPIALSN